MAIITAGRQTSLPPSGSASGDLSGTYPGPTVAKVNGVSVTGTAASGKVIQASSASAASWQTSSAFNGGTITNALTVNPATADAVSLTADQPAGSSLGTDIFEVYNANGVLIGWLDGNGSFQFRPAGFNGGLTQSNSGTVGVTPDNNLTGGVFTVNIDRGNDTVFAIRSAGTGTGQLVCTKMNTVPNDAVLNNGSFALWLDQTPAATKLMVKAKDSGGTVRTAAIALT